RGELAEGRDAPNRLWEDDPARARQAREGAVEDPRREDERRGRGELLEEVVRDAIVEDTEPSPHGRLAVPDRGVGEPAARSDRDPRARRRVAPDEPPDRVAEGFIEPHLLG